MRRQAWQVWAIGLALFLFGSRDPRCRLSQRPTACRSVIAASIHFFSYICHQQADRSFHVLGEQFAVCSRCFGVYFGLLLGFAVYPLWRNIDDDRAAAAVLAVSLADSRSRSTGR